MISILLHFSPYETVSSTDDPVASEVCSVLLEWNEMIRQLYIYRDETKFAQMQKLMEHLIDLRSQLLSGLLTQQQVYELKLNIANKISFGNRMLDLDLIPREENGEAVTTSNHGAVHIFNSVRIRPFYIVHSNICLSISIDQNQSIIQDNKYSSRYTHMNFIIN